MSWFNSSKMEYCMSILYHHLLRRTRDLVYKNNEWWWDDVAIDYLCSPSDEIQHFMKKYGIVKEIVDKK